MGFWCRNTVDRCIEKLYKKVLQQCVGPPIARIRMKFILIQGGQGGIVDMKSLPVLHFIYSISFAFIIRPGRLYKPWVIGSILSLL